MLKNVFGLNESTITTTRAICTKIIESDIATVYEDIGYNVFPSPSGIALHANIIQSTIHQICNTQQLHPQIPVTIPPVCIHPVTHTECEFCNNVKIYMRVPGCIQRPFLNFSKKVGCGSALSSSSSFGAIIATMPPTTHPIAGKNNLIEPNT